MGKEVTEIGNIVEVIKFDKELYKKNLEEYDWDSVEKEDGKGDDIDAKS